MTTPDFPAAHSMDTEWFAVDADGHVALFSTGEEGPIPNGGETLDLAPGVERNASVEDILLSGVVAVSPEMLELEVDEHVILKDQEERAAKDHAAPRHWWQRIFRPKPAPAYDMAAQSLFFVRAGVASEVAGSKQVTVLPADEGTLLLVELPPVAWVRELHAAGGCRGCIYASLLYFEDLAPKLGIYTYNHGGYGPILEPYGRAGAPSAPLRYESLPLQVRQQLQPLRLPSAHFERDAVVQPIDEARDAIGYHEPLGWRSPDSKTIHPLPGKERKLAEYLREHPDEES